MKERAHRQRQLDVSHVARALVVRQPARGAAAEGEEGAEMRRLTLALRRWKSAKVGGVWVCLPEGVQGAHGRVVQAAPDGQLGAVKCLQVGDVAHADAAHFIGGEQLERSLSDCAQGQREGAMVHERARWGEKGVRSVTETAQRTEIAAGEGLPLQESLHCLP
jgi:hypothetical protein